MFSDILRFHVEAAITSLFKRFLFVLEDLKQEHQIHFAKLRAALPPAYHSLLAQADYFDDAKFTHFRKRVLDLGNESKRIVQQEFERHEKLS